jgi:sulfatase maturation enzyme AslB (radical SAM superfamily)
MRGYLPLPNNTSSSNVPSSSKGLSLQMGRFFYLLFNQGGPGFCRFVITNLCNARCRFCEFARDKLKPQDISSVSREDGILSIDILYQSGVRYVYVEFVGGEPCVGSHLTEDFLRFYQL